MVVMMVILTGFAITTLLLGILSLFTAVRVNFKNWTVHPRSWKHPIPRESHL